MNKILQKCVNMLLVLSMLLTVASGLCISAHAEATSVKIVSFIRGEVDDLRSSELLEAKVSGYDGNLSDLTFTWSNQLGTYLYVYNSSNMYNIKDTAGEVEITGTTEEIVWEEGSWWPTTVQVPGETVSLKGYAWAAVYGANLGSNSLKGYIEVTVTDKNGNVIATDTYNGPFGSPNLAEDLDETNYGLFEGETIKIKDMLGRSAIVHIDCVECSVSAVSVEGNSIELNNDNSVTGKSAGIAEILVTVKKNNCKFHQNSNSETASHKVYVFKKPVTTTTTTTMTLTNIDANCDYFIGNTKGTKSSDGKTVVFTGLTPDTVYEVTVRGEYKDAENKTQYVYAYVTDRTKPVYKATVFCYTDNELADFFKYFQVEQNLFLKESNKNDYIPLTRVENAEYVAEVKNGTYYVYYKNGNEYTRIGDYQITIDNENNSLNIYTYSLKYDLDGGTMNSKGSVYYEGTAVYATSEIPTKEGSIFAGWEYKDKIYNSRQLVTEHISEAIVLTAKWEDAVNVKVNVEINHNATTGGYDTAANRSDITFRLYDKNTSAPVADSVSLSAASHNGYVHSIDETTKTTTYTANTASFSGSQGAQYTVSCLKSGYEVINVEQTTAADGTVVLNVNLEYDPKNFDLAFEVNMDKDVPEEFYPAGANVKVTFWKETKWQYITQHGEGSSVYVEIDENGKGNGSYPVWKTISDTEEPYYYSIDVVSYVLKDGTVVPNTANAFKSTVDVVGTENPYPMFGGVEGAYFASEAQHGTPVATITIDRYDLTFNANGGEIKGSGELTLKDQVIIPDLLEYVPTRDDGYTFTGWYTDSNCKTKAVSGTRLTAPTTLYAGWEAPLSVSGKITVEGFYEQNGTKVDVHDVDRAKNIVTTLQVKHGNNYNDFMSLAHVLTYDNNGIATVNYSFNKIPDTLSSGTEYRIRTVLINYETKYNNNGDTTFTSEEYTAIFDGKAAKVDALLEFKADEFEQNYEIDSTLIGEGFRPQNGVTQVLFQTDGTTPPDTVISQHTVAPGGEKFDFGSDGIARGSLKLWKGISSGAMSTYQLQVTTINGAKYNNDSTYTVRYGATTIYNVAEGSAGTLKARLVPKEYIVKFELNAGEDTVGGMEDYLSTDGQTYFTTHKWSYDTPIAARPTRDGYVFEGWEAKEGVLDEEGKYIKASVAEDVILTAKWSEFRWTTDTDTGHIVAETGNKESVVRFLFDVQTTDAFREKIKETGIRFVNSSDITEKVESNFAGKALTGSATTFYGDIVNIPESAAGTKYMAMAYIQCNDDVIYWSDAVECSPVFDDFIKYE